MSKWRSVALVGVFSSPIFAQDKIAVIPLQPRIESQKTIREFLESAGVDLDKADAPRYFYNDRTGKLHVAGDPADIALISKKAETRSDANVLLKVQVAEVRGELGSLRALATRSVWDSSIVASMQHDDDPFPADRIFFRAVTEAQALELRNHLLSREDAEILEASNVATLSGRSARIAIETEETITIPPFSAPGPKAREALRFNAE